MIHSAFISRILAVSYLTPSTFGAAAIAPIEITNNPNITAKTCNNFTLTWKGGLAPYTVQVHYRVPAGQGTNELLELDTMIANVKTTSFTTKLIVPPNAQSDSDAVGFVRFGVWGSQLNVNSFPLFDQKIAAGPDASCNPTISTANDTRPQSPFQDVALVGPGNTVPECAVSNFQILGEIGGGGFPGNSISIKTVGLANDQTLEIFNLISTNVSLKLPFPAGTSFTSAAASNGEAAPDIQRTVSAGSSKCVGF